MSDYDYDLFTIGAGSGGVRASRVSAQLGARVAVAEERDLGGTCVNVGCVPKKLMVYASAMGGEMSDAAGFGWQIGERKHHWPTLIANKDREIERLNGVYRKILLNNGVTLLESRATIVDPHTVEVDGKRITAANILVATGSWPTVPTQIDGAEHAITSNEVFHLKERPRRVVVGGGGYIAVEFAGIFHGLGSEVTLVHRGDQLLRGFDDDLRAALGEEIRKQGIDLRLETTLESIRPGEGGLDLRFSDGREMQADQVLCAMGRHPNVDGLGLEAAGVKLDPIGAIVVDGFSRTNVPSIWAIGDVTNRVNLTPVAIAEGQAFARTVFGDDPTEPDYRAVPSAVFSQPNLGSVGLTEAEARERHGEVTVYRSQFRPMKHTLSGRDEKTTLKMIVETKTDLVLGCHMLGPDAGEIIQGLGVALKCGATKAQFDATVGIHPTTAEEFVTMR